MPCTTPHLLPPLPFAPCPATLSCLCSHHNKPGADGALLCLADSDRQALSANSLPGNQLTGLDSARCLYHFSPPSVGGADGGDRAAEYRGDKAVGGGLQQVLGDLCADRIMPLSEAPWDWSDTRATNRCKQPPAEPPRIPPWHIHIVVYWRVAYIWIKDLCAREHRTGMPRWDPRGKEMLGFHCCSLLVSFKLDFVRK